MSKKMSKKIAINIKRDYNYKIREDFFMDVTAIKNKLITYKNYGGLKKELVCEIQDTLLHKTKPNDFASLLKRIENEGKTLN